MESVYKAVVIEEGFWAIEEGGVRSFLFEGADKAMLVDTGFGKGDIKAFAESLTDKPIFLVNTHGDPDHIGCNKLFDKVYMHPAEFDFYLYEQPDRNANVVPIWEGDTFELGNKCFEVILIPGHTPGSIALFDRKNGIIIGGDSIQRGPIFMFGRGRNLKSFVASMEKLKKIQSEIKIVYAAHGNLTVEPALIDDLAKAAAMLLNGEIEGKDFPGRFQCKVFEACGIKFLYI